MKRLILIPALWLTMLAHGQDLPPSTQRQLENLADAEEKEGSEEDDLLEQLSDYKKHPLNLNTASTEELQSLGLLNDLQIGNLIRYRILLGPLLSMYELQAVPAWDLATIRKIIPFVTVVSAVSVKESFLSRFKGEQDLLFRISRVLEKSGGYDTALSSHYLGDRNHLLFRYRYQYKSLLYFGLTGEKDAGEQFFKGAQKWGFDFYSIHFFARNMGLIKSLAIGDYTANLGQGLIQWQSLAFGKSSEVINIKRQAPVLMPYRSSGEFYFNRGAGITLQKRKISSTLFASYKKLSGNVVTDSSERFTSLSASGYHRNASEIADRNSIALASLGGNISYQNGVLKVGWNAVMHHFAIPVQKKDEPYNRYAIEGKKFMNSSIDYAYTFRNLHLFGEAAVDRHFHKAVISGLLISLHPKVDMALLYRNIQSEYQAIWGNAFIESTAPSNEKGMYAGISVRPFPGWQLNAYADWFAFPWLRYRVNGPTAGYDYLLMLSYQPRKQFDIYLRYKSRNKPLDGSGDAVIAYPEDETKQDLRLHFSGQVSRYVTIKSRAELLLYNHEAEEGFLSYVESSYDRQKLSLDVRLQYFESNSYNSRIYAYESDVLYNYSIPAFYDKGLRYYLNLHYDITRALQCWIRWARTVYPEKTETGSGLDAISGHNRSEIRLQLRYLVR